MRIRIAKLTGSIVGTVAIFACHQSPTAPSLPATLSFAQPPIPLSAITFITPLGNLNPPGHTLPTNHIYFYHPAIGTDVTAPAGGTIMEARRETDDALYVQATPNVLYYLGHLLLDAGIVTGGSVTAGQHVGMTAATLTALDLGVSNNDVTLFFVRPDRYIPFTIHADSPLKYFAEPARTQVYAKVQRNGADKDGKIDFDRAGRLAGNWFVDGLPAATTENVENGFKHLSFVRDVVEPTLVRISIGGSVSIVGAFFVADGSPDPADVTTATGRVGYRLVNSSSRVGTGVGVLVVQMLADDRIRVEAFPAGTSTSADFSAAALVYTR